MAVTKREDEYKSMQQYPQSGYQGLAGVSENTAQRTQQAQQQYQPSQAAQTAQQQLQQVQAQKPQTYNSKYGAQLDNILQQITNPKEFKYSFDGDELFKYYADLYTQKGKQASLDAMGQAAALTGGYGNSYGQMVGNQAFDQYLLSLYDKGMDLRDKAYQQYRDRMGDQQTAYNLLAAQDATDYGRHRDAVTDWQNDQNYWTNRADTEQDRAYNEYINNLNYWTQQAGAENADYWNAQKQGENARQFDVQMAENARQYDTSMSENIRQYDTSLAENARQADAKLAEDARQADQTLAEKYAELNEKIRQFDAELDFDKMTNEQKYAAQWVSSILANGQMPSLELLKAAGLSEEDARKLMAQLTSGGGGGGGTKNTKTVYYDGANYYTISESGKRTNIKEEEVAKNNYYIDDSPKRTIEQGVNMTQNAIDSVVNTIRGSQEVQNAGNLLTNAITKLVDPWTNGLASNIVNNAKEKKTETKKENTYEDWVKKLFGY